MAARILVDGGSWANDRGFGRFARCLVGAMALQAAEGELSLLLDPQSAKRYPVPDGVSVVSVSSSEIPSEAASAGGARSIPDLLRFARAARRTKPSVVFFPATYTYFPTPGLVMVVTVHDAMAESMPELIVPRTIDRVRWNAKQWLALRSAAHVFTVSEEAAVQVQDRLRVSADRLSVIAEAADPVFAKLDSWNLADALHRLERHRPYVLYVGGFGPHKNVLSLVQAFELLAPSHPELELVLVGSLNDPFTSSPESLFARIAQSVVSERIVLTGFVADADLSALYNGARLTVLPSFEEGFGLTAVESAACGTPVVSNHLPSVEASLGTAALYVDARDHGELADGIRSVLNDDQRRQEMVVLGLERAAEMQWSKAASEVLALLRSVSERSRR